MAAQAPSAGIIGSMSAHDADSNPSHISVISLGWNVFQTGLAGSMALGVPLAALWGWSLRAVQDSGYAPAFLIMCQVFLLLLLAPTALAHSQRLRARGATPASLVRTLFVLNLISTTLTLTYLALGILRILWVQLG